MSSIYATLLLSLVSFIGAVGQTLGVITFFALDGLAPHRWPLILGGTGLIAISETLQFFFRRRMRQEVDRNNHMDD
jgi:hypothetical protein